MKTWTIATVTPMLTVLLAGCGSRLNVEAQALEVPAAGKIYEIDPIKSEQTIKVTVASKGGPVSVHVYLKKDQDAAEASIMARKNDRIVAQQLKTESAEVQARIPANEAAMVRIDRETAKPTTVSLKITN